MSLGFIALPSSINKAFSLFSYGKRSSLFQIIAFGKATLTGLFVKRR